MLNAFLKIKKKVLGTIIKLERILGRFGHTDTKKNVALKLGSFYQK
jgi:hypothetical protein